MAGCFLFKGDDVKKKLSVLSGGEQARLCLAGLLLTKSQVLLLDEPTNHLDFETVEALGKALKEFAGTLFFISHDRTFVNLIATQILEIKDGRVLRYPGSYEDYVYHLEMRAKDELFSDGKPEISERHPHSHKKHPEPAEKIQEPVSFPANPAAKSESARTQKEITKLEIRIKHLTRERDALLKEFKANPFHYSRQRNERLKELTAMIEEDENRWLGLQATLDPKKAG